MTLPGSILSPSNVVPPSNSAPTTEVVPVSESISSAVPVSQTPPSVDSIFVPSSPVPSPEVSIEPPTNVPPQENVIGSSITVLAGPTDLVVSGETKENSSTGPIVENITEAVSDLSTSHAVGTVETLKKFVAGIQPVKRPMDSSLGERRTLPGFVPSVEVADEKYVDVSNLEYGSFALSSQPASPVEINIIKVPLLNGKMVYNYFDEGEEMQDDSLVTPSFQNNNLFAKMREYRNNPNSSPRYVELSWAPVKTTQEILEDVVTQFSDEQEKVIFEKDIAKPENLSDIVVDGLTIKLVDTQETKLGFDNICNHADFPNTVSITISKSDVVDNMKSFDIVVKSTKE